MAIIKTEEIPTYNLTAIEIIKREKEDKESKHPPECPCCGSNKVYGISRVVGYFSIIENWNFSKQTELKARQKGKYWTDEGGRMER